MNIKSLSRRALTMGIGPCLLILAIPAHAQSPATIGGRTITLTISTGTFPFAASGLYRFLPSAIDASYAIVPVSGDVDASSGTHTYLKTDANTARLSLNDTEVGGLTADCTFTTEASGSYTLTSSLAPGSQQSGTFALHSGPSPVTITGKAITVTVTSGEFPFAGWGSYQFLPSPSDNTYTITALSGVVQNSSGTYAYSQNSAHTGVITFTDSVTGPGLSSQLSFDSPTTGTLFLRKSGDDAYQTGVFSISVVASPPVITVPPQSRTVSQGESTTFSVTATGSDTLTYQWRKDGVPLANAVLSSHIIGSVQPSDQGAYDVIVSNSAGSVTSASATLLVTVPEAETLRLKAAIVDDDYLLISWLGVKGREYGVEVTSGIGSEWMRFTTDPVVLVSVGEPMELRIPLEADARLFRVVEFVTPLPPPTGMALIPAGSFMMGDTFDEGSRWDLPVHEVYVLAFYMDQYEVTKAMWDEVRTWANANAYDLGTVGDGKASDHPVHTVNWYHAVKWCNARSEMEGRMPAYYTDAAHTTVYRTGQVNLANDWVKWNAGYRLPTEAEWEKAARGGVAGRRFSWNDTDDITHGRANYRSSTDYAYDVSPTQGNHPDCKSGGTPYTSPVGSFEANGYGLYDMAGNVWEWCWDWYLDRYYSVSVKVGPLGPASVSYQVRVIRGGSWDYVAVCCQVAFRLCYFPNDRNYHWGFRSVLPLGQR